MWYLFHLSVIFTILLCGVSAAPKKKVVPKGDICLDKCDSRKLLCYNDCKFPIAKNRTILFNCFRRCKRNHKRCTLECVDEGGTVSKAKNKNGGGTEIEAERKNKTRSDRKQKTRKNKSKKRRKEKNREEPENNTEIKYTEPWWMGENSALGWLLDLMELWSCWCGACLVLCVDKFHFVSIVLMIRVSKYRFMHAFTIIAVLE